MSSITTIYQNLADMQDAIAAERELAMAERNSIIDTINALREGLNDLEVRVSKAFGERDASMQSLIGNNGGPPLQP